MPFSVPAYKKYLHKSETQHFTAAVTTLQAINNEYCSKAGDQTLKAGIN